MKPHICDGLREVHSRAQLAELELERERRGHAATRELLALERERTETLRCQLDAALRIKAGAERSEAHSEPKASVANGGQTGRGADGAEAGGREAPPPAPQGLVFKSFPCGHGIHDQCPWWLPLIRRHCVCGCHTRPNMTR